MFFSSQALSNAEWADWRAGRVSGGEEEEDGEDEGGPGHATGAGAAAAPGKAPGMVNVGGRVMAAPTAAAWVTTGSGPGVGWEGGLAGGRPLRITRKGTATVGAGSPGGLGGPAVTPCAEGLLCRGGGVRSAASSQGAGPSSRQPGRGSRVDWRT